MSSDERKRLVIGVVAIVLASSLMPFADDTTPLIPVPTHNFVAYLFLSWGYLLVLPAVFAVSYWAFGKRGTFRALVLGAALSIAVLNAYWIADRWEMGLDYPGARVTRAVVIENALMFAGVIALAGVGVLRGSRAISSYAYIALFVALGWCAFPLLGRVDL
ncbi:MAG TPA: hypothetical protein VHH11_09705 [Gammaproteobacteria bacterium]|jgi:hypothetical protein|nr:hypothetical protein [Gammaproteobacteria bacterium]